MSVSQLRDSFFSPFVVAIFYVLLVVAGLAFLGKRNALFVAGDAGTKLLQTRDFVEHKFKAFNCIYPGKSIDPQEEFFPFWAPFAYKLNGNCEYVFPVFLAIFDTPAYLVAKGAGFFLLSSVASIGILFLVWGISNRLGLSRREVAVTLWITALGIGLPSYAFNPNEPAVTCFFSVLAIYFFLKETNMYYILSGIAIGCGLLLRPDAILTGVALGLSMLLFYPPPWKNKVSNMVFFGLPVTIFAAVLFLVNLKLFGHPMGVRSQEVQGMETDLFVRMASLASYLFGNSEAVFVRTPIFILALLLGPGFVLRKKYEPFARMEINPRLLTAGMCVLCVILVIPFLWTNPNHGGPRFGERHLFNAYPLLAILAGYVLARLRLPTIANRILFVLVIVAIAFTARANFQGFKGSMNLQRVRAQDSARLIQATETGSVIILRHFYLGDMIYSSFHDRIYFVAENDPKFVRLENRLRAHGIKSYYVMHSRAPFRGTLSDESGKPMTFPETMVPPGTILKSVGDDKGTELFELRRYDL